MQIHTSVRSSNSAVAGDVGQGAELTGLEEKAKKTGASKLYVADLTEEFVKDYIFPTLKAGAKYEGMYLLGTSFARPVIAKRIVEIAKAEGADAIAHGCTGKGNDQVRFELTIKALAPEMKIIAFERGDRLCRGAQYPAGHQPRDQLFQGQEHLAPVA